MAIGQVAFNLLSSVLPSFAFDQVAVFTQDFTQVFKDARALKAVIKEQAKVMEHPVESGAIITDHRIILPVEVELSMILTPSTYKDVYKEIRQYYLNGTLLVVQTRAGIYQNQLIASMPHEEDSELYDTITIALSLKEVLFATAQYGVVPKNTKNSTTVSKGTQQGTTPSAPHYTAAQQLFEGKR
jgi:hypothetical protein